MGNNEVVYIRCTRPNQVNLRLGGLKLSLTRRGTREDSLPISRELTNTPAYRRSRDAGLFEEITEEEYMRLIDLSDTELAEDQYELEPAAPHMSPITKIEIYAEKDQDLTNEIYQTHIKEDAAALRPKMTPVIRYLENGGQEDLGPGASVDFEAAKAGEEVRLSNPRPRNDANKSKAEVLPAGDPTRRKTVKGVVGNDQA